jgi:hypothetical protein
MGLRPIDFAVDFTLERQHTFRMRRIAGFLTDIYEIYVDEERLVQARVGGFDLVVHSQQFNLDDRACEIRWQQGFGGDPKYVALLSEGRVVAFYGNERHRREIADSGEAEESAGNIERVTLIRVTRNARSREVVGTERVSIDNRSGSDSVTRRTQVSKTIEQTLTTSVQRSVEGSISASIYSVIEGQLAQKLTWDSSHQVGETMTSSEEVELTVKGGAAVVYELTWTVECERGEAEFRLGGSRHVVSYEARYGLEMSIKSR